MPRHLIDLEPPVEKAFLVAVDTGAEDGWTAQESLSELANLATTAGADVVGAEWQNRRHVDPNWYIGKGKAEELAAARRETGFDVLIADDELSPAQQRSLEELLKVKVIDRSRLILDIFAQHAQTHEGRLQVEDVLRILHDVADERAQVRHEAVGAHPLGGLRRQRHRLVGEDDVFRREPRLLSDEWVDFQNGLIGAAILNDREAIIAALFELDPDQFARRVLDREVAVRSPLRRRDLVETDDVVVGDGRCRGASHPDHRDQDPDDDEVGAGGTGLQEGEQGGGTTHGQVGVVGEPAIRRLPDDRVAVVEEGRLQELGTHDELVRNGSSYAALWDSWHGDR